MPPRVVLIGSMGAGKTSVGKLLAGRWGEEFRDTDADIEADQGMSVQQIFVDAGEEEFRRLERDAVASALAQHTGVLALGGGAPIQPGTGELLDEHRDRVVFLRVGLSAAAERVGLGVSRPMLLGNVRGRMKQLIDERTPVYQGLASSTVDTDGRSVDEVADLVEAALAEGER